MRECTEKMQKEFAGNLNRKRGWTEKLEGSETNITLKDFLALARISNIDIIMKKK